LLLLERSLAPQSRLLSLSSDPSGFFLCGVFGVLSGVMECGGGMTPAPKVQSLLLTFTHTWVRFSRNFVRFIDVFLVTARCRHVLRRVGVLMCVCVCGCACAMVCSGVSPCLPRNTTKWACDPDMGGGIPTINIQLWAYWIAFL
jgi:hypothetical protein